jgi:hypothetical protein
VPAAGDQVELAVGARVEPAVARSRRSSDDSRATPYGSAVAGVFRVIVSEYLRKPRPSGDRHRHGGAINLLKPGTMFNKITVVGAGNVGATAAQRVAEKQLARTVVMVDVVDGVPQGKGLDQWQSAPIEGFDSRIIGTNGYDAAAGSELFIVTAGIARKPGMSRDDLVKTNAGIVESVA